MRTWHLAILLATLFSPRATAQFGGPPVPLQASPANQQADAAYVVSVTSGEIAVIRPEPPEVIGTIHVPGGVRRFTASRNGKWVGAVSTGSHRIALIDARTMAEPAVLRTALADGVCLTPDGRELWVTHSPGPLRIYRQADAGWTESGTVEGLEGSDDVLISSDGATCFVATRSGVALVDVTTRRMPPPRTKRGSDRMLLSPDERRLYVRNGLIETIYAVDTKDGSILADLEMNAGIRDLALSPDGSRYTSRLTKTWSQAGPGASRGTGEGAVEIIDCATHEPLVPVRTRGLTGSVAMDEAGKTLFVAHDTDGVQVIDTAERRIVTKLVSPAGPFLLAKWPGRNLVLALNATRTMLISGERRQFTASVPMGQLPLSVCFAGMGDVGGRAFLTKPTVPSAAAPRPRRWPCPRRRRRSRSISPAQKTSTLVRRGPPATASHLRSQSSAPAT